MMEPRHFGHHGKHRHRPMISRPFMRGPFYGPLGPHHAHMFMMGPAMILLYGGNAVKLHNDDIHRIQRDARRLVYELNEDDLRAAMKRLDITRLELSSEDRAEIERAQQWR